MSCSGEAEADIRPKLYFVKMDVAAAFDTIKQDKLIEVIGELLEKVVSFPALLLTSGKRLQPPRLCAHAPASQPGIAEHTPPAVQDARRRRRLLPQPVGRPCTFGRRADAKRGSGRSREL